MTMSLNEFGRRVGCDYTTASRLLSGDRAPSTRLLGRICQEFGLDGGEALRVLAQDRSGSGDGRTPKFADWLKATVFSQGTGDTTVSEEPLDTSSING